MQKRIKSFDGLNINYFIDRKSDFFLIFLHGAGGDLNSWRNYIHFFSKKGYSTLAIDLRGHGFSDKPLNKKYYSMEKYARDVYSIIKKEKIKKFILIGHCFGGMIALTFTRLFSNFSEGIVLINSAYKVPFLRRVFKIRSLVYLIAGFLSNGKLFSRNRGHGHYNKSYSFGDLINFKRIFSDVKDTGIAALLLIYSSMFGFNERSILKKINQPVLIIYGERDKFFRKRFINRMNRLIKRSELFLISDSNHWPIYEKSREIEKIVYNFLLKNRFY
jgi:pimeloyl-ACP methyl ester carboxylesterase